MSGTRTDVQAPRTRKQEKAYQDFLANLIVIRSLPTSTPERVQKVP